MGGLRTTPFREETPAPVPHLKRFGKRPDNETRRRERRSAVRMHGSRAFWPHLEGSLHAAVGPPAEVLTRAKRQTPVGATEDPYTRSRVPASGQSRWLRGAADTPITSSQEVDSPGPGTTLEENLVTIEHTFCYPEAVVSTREHAAVLALVEATDGEWYRTAALIEEAGSAVRLVEGDLDGLDESAQSEAEVLRRRVKREALLRHEEALAELGDGVGLVTVLDDAYPANLREIYNRPPFLFVRGELHSRDDRSVAIVGTRGASDEGRERAHYLASQLVPHDMTILSGLALGIDTAAHTGTLDAGGRTVAVLGHGIVRPIYPEPNRELAEQIAATGAVVSQFWPDAPPTRYSFPMRNVVMSGMAVGTIVVEASKTSGAKMQARLCLEHGKQLILLRSLLDQEEWARKYAEKPGATVVEDDDIDRIVGLVLSIVEAPEQLALC
jgi:DNA processing protein